MEKQNFWKQGCQLGLFLATLFTVCFLWFFIRGGSDEFRRLHNNLLALAFFGWSGINAVSLVLGLAQSFIWGYIALALWRLVGFKTTPR